MACCVPAVMTTCAGIAAYAACRPQIIADARAQLDQPGRIGVTEVHDGPSLNALPLERTNIDPTANRAEGHLSPAALSRVPAERTRLQRQFDPESLLAAVERHRIRVQVAEPLILLWITGSGDPPAGLPARGKSFPRTGRILMPGLRRFAAAELRLPGVLGRLVCRDVRFGWQCLTIGSGGG